MFVLLLGLVGCSSRVDRSFDADAGAGADAGDASACVCEVEWVRIVDAGDPPVRCDLRGECSPGASCEVVSPTSDDPGCALR